MSTTTTSSLPISPRYLAGTSAALGSFIIANNIFALYDPKAALGMLGFPLPTTPGDQKLVLGITRMFAATRIAWGAGSVAMWWFGAYKALGTSMVVGGITAVVDGLVSRDVIGKDEWGHWAAAPVGAALATGLILA